MAQTHINKTIADIEAKLAALITECRIADREIKERMQNDSEFFGSFQYYELQAKKVELSDAYNKLFSAVTNIRAYML